MKIVKYEHHNTNVAVREDLKGKHTKNCLCYANCVFFHPETPKYHCSTAQAVFKLCIDEHLVLPVWECPSYLTIGEFISMCTEEKNE